MDDPAPTASKLPSARERIGPINARLAQLYPQFEGLNYDGRFQLLIAVILSAQCTDARVNKVTPALFARFPTAEDIATCRTEELEQQIRSVNFFHNKAKNIRACCVELVNRFGSEVPSTIEELVTLPGVGRKTANVVLGHGFDTPGITVDTHVGRVARRLGLTRHKNPAKVELALAEIVPHAEWLHFSGRLIMHGRKVCQARKPRCEACAIADLCPKIGVKGVAKKHRSRKARSHAHKAATNGDTEPEN